jgi:hypothetical protein
MSDNFADRQRRLLEDTQRAEDSAKEQRSSLNRALGKEMWGGADATDRLREVIEKHQQESARQTQVMVWLTWVMMVLTIATVALAGVQVWITLR